MSSDNSTNVSTDALLKNRIDNSSHSAMSSLELSHQSDGLQILSKNTCTTNTNPLQIQCKNLTSLQLSNEKPNNNVEKSTSTNMSSLHISSDSNKDKNNIGEENVNKCIEKSTSTNMSLLLISSDSIKDKTNQKENNFVNAHSESIKKNPLTKAKQNQSYNSNTSANNSFSPLNSNLVIEVLNILDKTTLPDENVTKRRGRNSVNKSIAYRTRRKTILPDGNNTTDSDNSRESEKIVGEASPSKKLKINSKSEVRTQTPPQKKVNDSDDCNNKNKKLRERRRTANKKNEPDITSKKTNKDKCINKTSDDSQSVSDTNDSSGSERKRRRLRKLYNPDESINDVIESDEKEREDKRTKVTKQKSDGVILNPNIVCVTSNILLTTRAKEFIDKNNIDIQTVLNKESESEKEITSVKRGKKKDEKKVSINGDADEQQELAEEFINKKKTKKRTTQHVNSEGKVVNRRQSARLSQHPRKKLNLNSSTSSNDVNTEGMLVKKRQSVRLSQHPKKKFNLNSSTSSNEERGIIPITPVINRRSTMEFQTLTQMSAKKRLKIDISKRPSIVCTKLHKDGIQVFNQIVKKLGGFVIEDEVSSKTTHLVAGESKRTINIF
ncbi:hypothetical protein NQ314_007526 [Rhamnusium bicolor]|uniref:BRCT domain-containing protein n=1 Tax=Rhamnusium bicolor TaxID=1586634 RepID=A0AAV8YNG1_9CUCU|nr:hypothetical protein NQ314_007526 [Rhamnusium bicolor]